MARLFISFLILLVGWSLAVAQERIIDEETYNREIGSASEYRLNENYREKRTTISTMPGSPATLEISEYEQPGPKMRVRVFRIDRNETVPTLETIFIGQRKYEKRQGLAWQVDERKGASTAARYESPKLSPPRSDVPRPAPVAVSSETPKAEYKDLGIEQRGSMRVFQRTVHSQMKYDGAAVEVTHIRKSWIDRSGRLKKDEYTTTTPKTGSTVLTMEYEVDPSIRIEAPMQ